MDLGPHAAFIWACYAAVAVTLAGLIFGLIANGRRYRRELETLEARGVSRRSTTKS